MDRRVGCLMRVLVLVLMLPLLGACSLTLGGTTLQGKDIIKGANTIKNISRVNHSHVVATADR